MDNKYLILLLFIFLVFLMGSINSSITNNFYNNSTGSQDHSNLSNLSYADSNHTGFQSSDSLDTDVAELGFVTNATMASDNTKYNVTGGVISGNVDINNGFLNLTTNQTFNFDFSTVPKLYRNSSGTSLRTAPLAALNMMLSVNGGMDNGSGAAIIFWSKDNFTQGRTEYNVGRFGINWDNKILNTSRYDFYYRSGLDDTTGSSLGFSVYGNNSLDYTNRAATFETGNLKLTNLSGSGNAYVCVDSAGKQYRGSPTC